MVFAWSLQRYDGFMKGTEAYATVVNTKLIFTDVEYIAAK